MAESPKTCIICGVHGVPHTWNGLDVLRCGHCGLAWRAAFDLDEAYYRTLRNVEDGVGEAKAALRLRNSADRIEALRKYLPRERILDAGAGDGSFLLALQEAGYASCVGIEPSAYFRDIAQKRGVTVQDGDIQDPVTLAALHPLAVTLFHVIVFQPPLEFSALGTGLFIVVSPVPRRPHSPLPQQKS